MKFKQQEEKVENNSFLNSVIDLLAIVEQFIYGIECFNNDYWEIDNYKNRLNVNKQDLRKLAISLDSKHVAPTITVTLEPVKSDAELRILEEMYYNMLKEIGRNALEQNEIEVISYITEIIHNFKHYFCKANEDNNSGETSS